MSNRPVGAVCPHPVRSHPVPHWPLDPSRVRCCLVVCHPMSRGSRPGRSARRPRVRIRWCSLSSYGPVYRSRVAKAPRVLSADPRPHAPRRGCDVSGWALRLGRRAGVDRLNNADIATTSEVLQPPTTVPRKGYRRERAQHPRQNRTLGDTTGH